MKLYKLNVRQLELIEEEVDVNAKLASGEFIEDAHGYFRKIEDKIVSYYYTSKDRGLATIRCHKR